MGALHIGNNIIIPTVVKTVETGHRYGASMNTFFGDEIQTETGIELSKPSTLTDILIQNVTKFGSSLFVYKFYANDSIRSFSAPDLDFAEYACLNNAFTNCKNLVSVTLGNQNKEITTNGGRQDWLRNAFTGCSNLLNVYINLITVNGNDLYYSFSNCTSLTSNPIPSIQTIGSTASDTLCMGYCYNGCTSLENFVFDNVRTVFGSRALEYAFNNCTKLKSLSFPALISVQDSQQGYTNTNQFHGMLSGCSNVTVHFPSNMQSKIGNWTDVTNGFGGSNITILFDLEATE